MSIFDPDVIDKYFDRKQMEGAYLLLSQLCDVNNKVDRFVDLYSYLHEHWTLHNVGVRAEVISSDNKYFDHFHLSPQRGLSVTNTCLVLDYRNWWERSQGKMRELIGTGLLEGTTYSGFSAVIILQNDHIRIHEIEKNDTPRLLQQAVKHAKDVTPLDVSTIFELMTRFKITPALARV